MPRKKIIRKVVDSDKPIKPQEALEILGIVTNNETALDAPVETSVIEEFVKEDTAVEEVPEVHIPQRYIVTMYHRNGSGAHAEIVGYATYKENTDTLTLVSPHPKHDAKFRELVNSGIIVTENGISRAVDTRNKKEWISNLCRASLPYRFEASEPVIRNETE